MVTVEASISGVGKQPLIRGILFACISASLASCGDRAAPLAPSGQGGEGTAGSGGVSGSGGAPGGVPDSGTDLVGSDGATDGDGRVATDEGCQPILNQAGLDTGFESCADGSKRRRAAILCPEERTSPSNPCQAIAGPYSCKSDSDCLAQPGGYCADAHQIVGYCGCYYGCRHDSDCDTGSNLRVWCRGRALCPCDVHDERRLRCRPGVRKGICGAGSRRSLRLLECADFVLYLPDALGPVSERFDLSSERA